MKEKEAQEGPTPVKTIKERPSTANSEKNASASQKKCECRLEGLQWEGILRTLRREIPINYQQICAQYRKKQSTRANIQGHLVRRKAQWKNKELRRTVTKKLLTQRITTMKVTVPPPLVVVSLLIYQWNIESIQLTPRRTVQDKRKGDSARNTESPYKWKEDTESPTTNERCSQGGTRGRLTKEAPWLVPPWGHLAIGTSGKDNLTKTAPWMVPPWRWKPKKSEVHRWLVRKVG